MTDEERQRQMDFIVNTLAQVSVRLDGMIITQGKTEQERRADEIRIGRLEESYVTLTRLAERFYERLDNHETRIEGVEIAQSKTEQERRADALRIARLEESFVTLTRLAERFDERLDSNQMQLDKVEQAIVLITKLLEGRNEKP